jgi:hypothetical protein
MYRENKKDFFDDGGKSVRKRKRQLDKKKQRERASRKERKWR